MSQPHTPTSATQHQLIPTSPLSGSPPGLGADSDQNRRVLSRAESETELYSSLPFPSPPTWPAPSGRNPNFEPSWMRFGRPTPSPLATVSPTVSQTSAAHDEEVLLSTPRAPAATVRPVEAYEYESHTLSREDSEPELYDEWPFSSPTGILPERSFTIPNKKPMWMVDEEAKWESKAAGTEKQEDEQEELEVATGTPRAFRLSKSPGSGAPATGRRSIASHSLASAGSFTGSSQGPLFPTTARSSQPMRGNALKRADTLEWIAGDL